MPATMPIETVWFQPIVDTTTHHIIGHECLSPTTGHSYTRQLAIRAISEQPKSAGKCFLNFIPSEIGQPSELLTDIKPYPGNIVMEAAGCNRNPDIVHLQRIRDYLHEQGLGLALDDVSDNAEALRLICDVRPDYIKVEAPPRHTTAVRRLVEIAERLNVCVIAKNVERVSTMEQLREAGIHCMQGSLFGCPSPNRTRDDSRVLPLELLDCYYAAPVLTNLNKEFLCALGIP
jgi:EAL domain-containing protein (putative c-di-GMP-specific phosphodiesterase class I)